MHSFVLHYHLHLWTFQKPLFRLWNPRSIYFWSQISQIFVPRLIKIIISWLMEIIHFRLLVEMIGSRWIKIKKKRKKWDAE